MSQAFEFLRFAAVGILNTVLDASVLNLLLLGTKRQELVFYSLFKAVSFTLAVIFSYFMNKSFVFKKEGSFKAFVFVSVVGALLNVGLASFGNKTCGNFLGQHLFILCANLGFLLGAGAVFVWNFFGYKLVVFRGPSVALAKKKENSF